MTSERSSATPGSRAITLSQAAQAEAEAAEAEAAAAEAAAAAAEARLRAIQTRQRVAAPGAQLTPEAPLETADTEVPDPVADSDVAEPAEPPKARRSRRSWAAALAAPAAVALIVACAGASGYMLWHHHTVGQEQQRKAEFNAAARQGVINLMSVDYKNAEQDVRRLLDSSTGKFRNDLQDTVDDLTRSLQQAKVTTTVTVQSTAVESVSADSGVVLVAASTEAVDDQGDGKSGDRRPARWRLAVMLTRDGGQLKMSQVDFIN